MRKFGIDISKWQGDFDFVTAKSEGINFAILKGGGADDGFYKDSKFEQNYTNAKKLGIPVGVYWFSKAVSINDAVKEADYFLNNILSKKQFELPVFIDVEHKDMINLGKDTLTGIVDKWCSYLENKGFWVGIYSSVYSFSTYMNDDVLKRYTHWVAQWANECTYKNKDILGFWQFGGETNLQRTNIVAGVVCDQNYMYKDFPNLIKNKNLNGFNANKPLTKSNEEIAKEVIKGLWDVGEKRKTLLTDAGYNYSEVQKKVNNLMNTKKSLVKAGDLAKMTENGVIYGTDKKFAPFVYNSLLYVRELNENRAVISIQAEGPVTGAVDVKYLVKVNN